VETPKPDETFDQGRFASEELLPLVYEELRRLASRRLEREVPGLTIQATALVHEAYMRLLGDGTPTWENKGHFFGAAAIAMRRILVERARRAQSGKHGGGRERVPLTEVDVAAVDDRLDFVALDAALRRMEREDERGARIVMLRFFAGLSVEETAEALGLSASTVKREWSCARAWLYDELDRTDHG
jgi:RNA polymerase sigma factor (TIGR02999 family)